MIRKILLILSIVIISFAYIKILILYLISKSKKTNTTAQEVALKVLSNEYSINLIKSNESYFSKYNIKRKMVKLSNNTYDSSDYFSQSISYLLSGYAISNNKYLDIISKIFKEIKVISFSSIIALIISFITKSSGDAKISLILLIIIAGYQYLLNIINTESISKVKTKKEEITKLLNTFNQTNTIFFITTLIQITRLVVIILDI